MTTVLAGRAVVELPGGSCKQFLLVNRGGGRGPLPVLLLYSVVAGTLSALLAVCHGSTFHVYPIPLLLLSFVVVGVTVAAVVFASGSLMGWCTVCVCAGVQPSILGVSSGGSRFFLLRHALCNTWLSGCVLLASALVRFFLWSLFVFWCPSVAILS